MTVEHQYTTFKLTMHAHVVRIEKGEITLREHIASKWLTKHDLRGLDWAAADLPIVETLMDHLKGEIE